MTVTIERLGHKGDGIAPGPIFVPMTLPGEVVDGDIDGDRISNPKIVTPSPDRVRAPCPHYRTCGGCALQHASDSFVADWKAQVIRTALDAQGLSAEFLPTETSPANSRRRAIFSARRTKKGVLLGLHARASDVIVPIPDCKLMDPEIMSLMQALETLVTIGGSRKSEMSVAVTVGPMGADVSVRGGKLADGQMRVELAGLVAKMGWARLTWGDEVIAMDRPPAQSFGPAMVVTPPGAFLQATREGEAALLAAVRRAVGPAKKIADLFAGSGTFALPLSTQAEVHAVEGEAAMIAALDKGWRIAKGTRAVTHEVRDLFRRPLMPDELAKFDAVVIDPPRAGAEAQTVELAAARVPRIAAVSCNPVTFARDARILTDAGYKLTWVQPVDQFRWSTHVELAAEFRLG